MDPPPYHRSGPRASPPPAVPYVPRSPAAPTFMSRKVRLARLPTTAPANADKKAAKAETKRLARHIAERQDVLYAERQRAVLVVVQGMDASGKDSVVRHAFGACNPVGLRPVSFKAPTDEERAHDFLWRVHRHAPEKGTIGLFIRSHYEDVVVQRVKGWIDADRVAVRYRAINAFERLLADDAGTVVLKFFLHLSKDEQEKELRERVETPEKNWKHSAADWDERRHWKQYQRAYEDAINHCDAVPWTVVPADQAWYRNLVVARAVAAALDGLDLRYPTLSDAEKAPFLA